MLILGCTQEKQVGGHLLLHPIMFLVTAPNKKRGGDQGTGWGLQNSSQSSGHHTAVGSTLVGVGRAEGSCPGFCSICGISAVAIPKQAP